MAADAKRLEEDEETGAQVYRYIKTGTNHFSLAYTYDCIAALKDRDLGLAVVCISDWFDDPIVGARG